jgi:hypothetical protein
MNGIDPFDNGDDGDLPEPEPAPRNSITGHFGEMVVVSHYRMGKRPIVVCEVTEGREEIVVHLTLPEAHRLLRAIGSAIHEAQKGEKNE